jgi:hypothetical protein
MTISVIMTMEKDGQVVRDARWFLSLSTRSSGKPYCPKQRIDDSTIGGHRGCAAMDEYLYERTQAVSTTYTITIIFHTTTRTQRFRGASCCSRGRIAVFHPLPLDCCFVYHSIMAKQCRRLGVRMHPMQDVYFNCIVNFSFD